MKGIGRFLAVSLLTLGALVGLTAPAVSAQTYTATLTGAVTDPNGAVLPNVKVVATNQGTKLEYTAQSSDDGLYTIPFLPIGSYVVSVEASGFKRLVSNPIQLEVNQTARVDLTMEVGEVSQQVVVEDVAPILQTESTTVGQVITGNTIVNLPLNGRNFQQLTLLVPGAITPNPGGFTNPGLGTQARPFVNGNREQGNSFLLDGISVDETIDNRIGYKPNVDAIAEFRTETSNSSSEFGNVTGAVVNATMKSGTNEFHGNLFEFFRNDALDGNSWSNNRTGARKQKLRQNIYGGTIGGPILRNKLFFFGAFQGSKQRTGGGTSLTVAPVEWRTGNLSSLTTPIRDPQRTGLCQVTPANPQPGVNYQAACFPGNIIPQNRIVNPAARALFSDPSLYPLPTRLGTAVITGNYTTTFQNTLDAYQFDIKIDGKLSDSDNVSGRYSLGNYETNSPQGTLPTNITGTSFSRPQNVALNWNHVFSPTVINEARVGFNRAVFISDFFDWANIGDGNAKLGIAGGQSIPGISTINVGNGITNIGSTGINEDNVTNTFHYGDNLSVSRGRHFMRMGAQWLRYQQNRFYPGNNGLLGFYTYDGRFTNVPFADFLLDQLFNKGIGSRTGTWGHRQNRIGIFFQDDFKARNNLTLNLGLRWEYTSPVVEVRDRQVNFDIATGRQLFAGRDGNSRALYDPYYKGFEPRIGFAWNPDAFGRRLVLRAGYGITQYMEGTGSNLRLPLNPPFFFEADRPFDATTGPGTITTGFTDVIVRDQPFGQIRIWNPDLRPQFTQQWNGAIEYQFSNSVSLTTAYVGHKATHLVAPTDWNQPLPGTGDPAAWAPLNQRRPYFRVYPLVTQVSGTDSWARSNYHALQASARQRLSRGLEFLISYTWSKTMTDNLGYYGSAGVAAQGAYSYNHYNRQVNNYGPAFFDATHNFVWSGTYELPVGRGRTWGNDWHPAVNAVLGGWKIGSIISAHTGFPITVTATDFSLQNPRGTARPNRIGDGVPDDQTIDRWLDINDFVRPPDGSFGNAGVGIVRAPGYANWDFSIGKQFYLSESKYFDFRTEFFNFTNHPSFGPPATNFSTPNTFGTITGTVSPPRNLEFALKFYF